MRVFGHDPCREPVEVLSRIGYLSEERDMPDWMSLQQLLRYTQAFYPRWDEAYAEQLRQMFELRPDDRVASLPLARATSRPTLAAGADAYLWT